jgi:hypothetical protein
MSEHDQALPARLEPYLRLTTVNQPVHVAQGPLTLVGAGETFRLDSDLTFKWNPAVGVVFEGHCPGGWLDVAVNEWTVAFGADPAHRAPCSLRNVSIKPEGSSVQGTLKGHLVVGSGSCQTVRFCLTNFPSYLGLPVRTDAGGGWARSRIEAVSAIGTLRLDEVEGADKLRKEAIGQRGFAITHVGEWVPTTPSTSLEEARDAMRMLQYWFGFLCGAWCGPVFDEGLTDGQISWRHFTRWKVTEGRNGSSWLPRVTPLDLNSTFAGFVSRWTDEAWQGPMISAIAWLVEANNTRAIESRILLGQVALELLAWVWLVERQQLHSRGDFGRLSAAEKIRALLHHARVQTALPAHMASLMPLINSDAFDGPGVSTHVRNALVHSHEHNRAKVATLTGEQLFECAELNMQYVELALLAVCGHSTHYALRGWKGWQGDDEVLVPWTG